MVCSGVSGRFQTFDFSHRPLGQLPGAPNSDLYHMSLLPSTGARPMVARSIAAAFAIIISGLVVGAPVTFAQTSPVVQKTAPGRQPTIVHAVVEDAGSHQEMFSMRADLRRLVVAQETY